MVDINGMTIEGINPTVFIWFGVYFGCGLVWVLSMAADFFAGKITPGPGAFDKYERDTHMNIGICSFAASWVLICLALAGSFGLLPGVKYTTDFAVVGCIVYAITFPFFAIGWVRRG